MSADLPDRLAEGVRVLLREFTINEVRFPAAEGRLRHNAIDFQSLAVIAAQPGCSALDVGRRLGASPTTLQSCLDRLVRAGLVSRERSDQDGRRVVLALTPEGLETHGAIRRQDLANCDLMLSALPEPARARFVADLERIAAHINPETHT
jgi:DNA-binding MarR family transcriptional regulator